MVLVANGTHFADHKKNTTTNNIVELNNKPVFSIEERAGSFSPQERAAAAQNRLSKIIKDKSLATEDIHLKKHKDYTDIVYKDIIITSITNMDARRSKMSQDELAKIRLKAIKNGINHYKKNNTLKNTILSFAYAFLVTIAFVLLIQILNKLFENNLLNLNKKKKEILKPVKIGNYELISRNKIIDLIAYLYKAINVVSVVVLVYLYLIIVLSFFAWSENYSAILIDNLVLTLKSIKNSIISYLPNLFFITITVLITSYINKFIKFFFSEIATERIKINGFHKSWADTTSHLARFLTIAFCIAIIFPYLPGANSNAFKGLSIFLGVLVSLGSTSTVANLIGGIFLTYSRAFEIGDRLKVGDTTGDVTEKALLVTRIKTIKNEVISIPNSVVLSNHIVNYSTQKDLNGLILHTSISIGYDVPWQTVNELLINAAIETENILKTPKPFVIQQKLDDFYVVYQINAYTNEINIMQNTYSELHKNIQNKFNEAMVEIMSPHYSTLRDGNKIAIPDNYIEKNYIRPVFEFKEQRSDI